ncbi:DUF2242 domain-containing protein [Thauera sinica]|uniref:DUF2242 domain-containing protein n=1 Tax=Thauera sinica TaxID=2665146 RepID=A0ABW1AVY2_9RHOO|nr:DUF2242 domain-containing protein [Thauera sp. K11]ATE60265.1 hypothetical protein CCZ27_10150 [Thauera sp. K11]
MSRVSSRLFPMVCAGLTFAGCASPPPPVYRGETFQPDSPFVTWIARDPIGACELGKRALLSQGYRIDDADPTRIRGEKFFQPRSDRGVTLGITLFCLPSSLGAAVYANGLETRYELKSAASSTAVNVAGIGGISLPWASDKEALVKVGEETISDAGFYKRLFGLIEGLASGTMPSPTEDAGGG